LRGKNTQQQAIHTKSTSKFLNSLKFLCGSQKKTEASPQKEKRSRIGTNLSFYSARNAQYAEWWKNREERLMPLQNFETINSLL